MSLKGLLVLEDGTIFKGKWHGGQNFSAVGEVVFNTSMQGYQEIVTDPSYYQQIVVMTTPEQGNYGVANSERESKRVYAEGFVCVELNKSWTPGRSDFQKELQDFSRPALSDIDTRALTLHLRSQGTPWGAMFTVDENLSDAEVVEKAQALISERREKVESDWVYEVCVKSNEFHKGQGKKGRVAILDYGTKSNILGEALSRFKEVGVFGSRVDVGSVLEWAPDGILLTNGPGDPSQVKEAAQTVQKLLGQIPIFGICMGHQILAQAVGGRTYKLKFGHRGGNHPVQNLATGEIYMTSQNHGYAVDADLPSGVKVSQINLYDKTVEGIEIPSKKAWSVQYHPEACPGPHDARSLFDHFAKEITK